MSTFTWNSQLSNLACVLPYQHWLAWRRSMHTRTNKLLQTTPQLISGPHSVRSGDCPLFLTFIKFHLQVAHKLGKLTPKDADNAIQ
jgi:hypothetical protein